MKRLLLPLIVCCLSQTAFNQTFTEVYQLTCGDTAYVSNLGSPTWGIAHIVERPAYGHAVLLGDFIPANLLEYTSPPCFAGSDTVIIECAHATQITCDTGIYIFQMTCPETSPQIHVREVLCNDSIYVDNLSGWQGPVITQAAQHGAAHIVLEPTDGAGVFYRPDQGFEGLDYVKVALSFTGSGDTVLYLFQVYCELTVDQQEAFSKPLALFPNPAGEHLFIQYPNEFEVIQLFDAQGRRQSTPMHYEAGQYRLEISHLPAGFYFLKAKDGFTDFVGRFIKS